MTLVECYPESFGGTQDELREGSDFEIESLPTIGLTGVQRGLILFWKVWILRIIHIYVALLVSLN